MSRSPRVRLGAVGYLNARPLVYGLDASADFDVRYDVPSECARLLHARETDLGLIPSIEYLRGPRPYMLVPGAGVTSKGPVASVAVYTRRDPRDIRSIAMDSSSRTSVALATIVLRRQYAVVADAVSMAPDLDSMLAAADAALIIGDTALFLEPGPVRLNADQVRLKADATDDTHDDKHDETDTNPRAGSVRLQPDRTRGGRVPLPPDIQKIDLGAAWTHMTGLPFVYAFWAGWPDALSPDHVEALQHARDAGVAHSADVARAYYPGDAERQAVACRYLRDNIRYVLGPDELEGLQAFYRYATELDLVGYDGALRFYHAEHHGAR